MKVRVTTTVEPVLEPGQQLTRAQVDAVVRLRGRVEAAVYLVLADVPKAHETSEESLHALRAERLP